MLVKLSFLFKFAQNYYTVNETDICEYGKMDDCNTLYSVLYFCYGERLHTRILIYRLTAKHQAILIHRHNVRLLTFYPFCCWLFLLLRLQSVK